MSTAAAVAGPAVATAYAVAKRALSPSGVLGAWLIGVPTGGASHRLALHLYFFFLSSSRITRVGEALKRRIEGEFKKGGYRDFAQVMANGGVGMLIALLYLAAVGWARPERPMRVLAHREDAGADTGTMARRAKAAAARRHIVGLEAAHMCLYASMNGDTWASELGMLNPTPPRLITTLATVPAGTNGGVSAYGLAASGAGGLALGLAALAYDALTLGPRHVTLGAVAQATAAGLVGSLVDSVLGAALQYSGAVTSRGADGRAVVKVVNEAVPGAVRVAGRSVLTNNQVNLLSGLLTAVAGYYTVDWFYPSIPDELGIVHQEDVLSKPRTRVERQP